MSEWQPIETAPKDGREIVVHDARTKTSHVSYYQGDVYGWYNPDNHYYSEAPDLVPTHWLPLPDPPKE